MFRPKIKIGPFKIRRGKSSRHDFFHISIKNCRPTCIPIGIEIWIKNLIFKNNDDNYALFINELLYKSIHIINFFHSEK